LVDVLVELPVGKQTDMPGLDDSLGVDEKGRRQAEHPVKLLDFFMIIEQDFKG
jgi:hypothetical protein